jgi:hypothetical protein
VNLSSVLRRALKGDDIGIVVGGQVVALRPVEILSLVPKLHLGTRKIVVAVNNAKSLSCENLAVF